MFILEKASPQAVYTERVSYPFDEMFVGDSILINDFKKAESARISALQYAKRRGGIYKFSLRKTREGWRIFRVA